MTEVKEELGFEHKDAEINTKIHIKELSDLNKIILSGFLYHLSERYQPLNNKQKEYLHTIINQIGLSDLRGDMPLAKIENISDKLAKKAILHAGMEFIYLKDESLDFMNDFNDFLKYFAISDQEIIGIEDQITRRYQKPNIEVIDTISTEELTLHEEINDIIEIKNIESQIETLTGKIVPKTNLSIKSNMSIEHNHCENYKNKVIHIKDTILVNGHLVFENCEIHFQNDKTENIITVTDGGLLEFNDCTINTEKPCRGYEILLSDATLSCNNTIFNNCSKFAKYEHTTLRINNCKFENCSKSIFTGEKSNGGSNTINFDQCSISYNIGNFIIEKSNCIAKFNECKFTSNKCLDQNENYAFYEEEEFCLIYLGDAEFNGCYFEGNNGLEDIELINSITNSKVIIKNSIFKDIICSEKQIDDDSIVYKEIINLNKGNIEKCEFYSTTGTSFKDEVIIYNTKFIKCVGKLISCNTGKISTSSFKECINKSSEMWECIINVNSYSEDEFCKIEDCIFEKCDTSPNINGTKTDSIIRIYGNTIKTKLIASVKNCVFRKCITSTGAVINSTELESGFFRQKIKTFASISECENIECTIS